MKNKANELSKRFFYHSDHLGSSSFITDVTGNAIQHLQYLPFGETFVDQQTGTWDTPYQFSGKEKDDETGYSYFGARYYDSDLSVWLSVDPMAGERSWVSSYSYCQNNPIGRIDPTGALDGDYYAMNGTYLGNDGIDDDKVYLVKNNCYSMSESGQSIIIESGITDLTESTGITNSEFEQVAAFAFNETYSGHDIDKYRVANAIKNRNKDEGSPAMQKTLDKVRYNGDSHKDRMSNVQKYAGTATKEYSKFINTSKDNRNSNRDMRMAIAATANAMSVNGIDYTTSSDGDYTATQWRGGKSSGAPNRFFINYPPSSSNQIKTFKNDVIF